MYSNTLRIFGPRFQIPILKWNGYSKGKNSMGWFFGLKLHMVINPLGEIMSFKVPSGATDDRAPLADLLKNLRGWLFGDRGYLGQEFIEKIKKKGVDVFTRVRRNMKKKIFTNPQNFFSE
jgi:hypothetical protein